MGRSGDMIVNIMKLPAMPELPEGVEIKRALSLDKRKILRFIEENFGEGWLGEADVALSCCPSHCVIAVKEEQVVGFACWDATAKGFFGPTGVSEQCRGKGVGKALLLRTLAHMREEGYVYGIIGWVDDARVFYEKTLGATFIPGGDPRESIYGQMIRKI